MLNPTRTHLVNHYKVSKEKLLELPADGELPLSTVLSNELIASTLEELGIEFRNRVFNPAVTLWLFVSQMLSGDHSCQNALNRFIAWLSSTQQKLCSTGTGGYIQARNRLPLSLIKALAMKIDDRLHQLTQKQHNWSFRNKPVKLVDGTTLTISDTKENRKKYPKRKNIFGFPVMRLVGIISLSTGTLMDLEMAPQIGKGTGEITLFLKLLQKSKAIQKGDVLLMDRLYCCYLILGLCLVNKVDFVVPIAGMMKPEKLEEVKKLGEGDRLVILRRPKNRQSSQENERILRNLPELLILREITHKVKNPGFRPKKIVILTSFLDPKIYPKEELAELHYERWNCELDLRNIKCVLNLDHLKCKTPAMLEKEIWAAALAYNLVRTVMAQASISKEHKPRDLSFKGAVQTINSFRPLLEIQSDYHQWCHLYLVMLEVISKQRIFKRPGRIEPRAVKKRSIPYMPLKVSRAQGRKLYWRRGAINIKRNKSLAKGA